MSDLVHCASCERQVPPQSDGLCPYCNSVVVEGMHKPEPVEQQQNSLSVESYEISDSCPRCKSFDSITTSANAFFTVRYPRQCVECNFVYYRAVSRPRAFLILVVGLLILSGGLLITWRGISEAGIRAAWEGLVLVGGVTVWHGKRCLGVRAAKS